MHVPSSQSGTVDRSNRDGALQMARAFAPATVANVGCGFDVLGFAIEQPGDEVTARRVEKPGLSLRAVHGDQGRLPVEVGRNTAGVAAAALLEALGTPTGYGIELELFKNMPLGSGMGSSAASAVAAAVAVNHLLGQPFERGELLRFAIEGERVACGTAHADNAAASLLGGFVFIRSNNPLDVVPLAAPSELFCTIVHPRIEIRTEDTRKILRKQIPLATAVTQWGNVGALVAGLLRSDYALISRSLKDEIIEPIRSVLIPGYDMMKAAALEAGALGCSISGSGPSVFALSRSGTAGREVGEAMKAALDQTGLGCDIFLSDINRTGSRIITEEG